MKVKKIYFKDVKQFLPKRKTKSHKALSGKCLVIAGSKGMFGAAILCSTAAARSGAGYTLLMTDLKKFKNQTNAPDFLTLDYTKTSLLNLNFSAAAIGPGLGLTRVSNNIVKRFLKLNPAKAVLDADALTLIAGFKKVKLPQNWVITPHEGEMQRLIKKNLNRVDSVVEAHKKLGCIVLLKGYRTLIYDGSTLFQIQTGNAALAKAGTGDVLTGMIAGFIAQGVLPINAAILAATLHGKMSDEWVKNKDVISLMASDLVNLLPKIIKKLRNS